MTSMTSITSMTSVRFGDWTLYPREGELERDGERQRLQDLPLRILLELLGSPGQLVTREQLIAKLWPKGVVEFEGGLNTAVSKLRATLCDDAEAPKYIETIPRKGYRLICAVTPVRASDESLPRAAPADGIAAALVDRRALTLYAAAFAVGLAAVAFIGVRLGGEPPPPGHLRLAVMPFENLSADPANAFFADGMHEEVLATLASRAAQLEVVSRTTMMTFRASNLSATAIAADLGATHLLEGAVRREGNEVRVTVSLIDARDDRQTWSQTFDRELGNAVSLQADVAEQVASQLAVQLTGTGAALPAATSPVAYDLYLRAKLASQAVNQRTSPDETHQIERWLGDAIALDASFGAAYLERARIRIVRFVRNHDLGAANVQGAELDLEAARRLLGDTAEVAALRSRYLVAVHADRSAASWLDTPALVASRDSSVMLWRAFSLCRTYRPEEGLRVYAQVAELDPLNRGIFSSWAIELWGLRRPAEALQVIQSFNRRGVGRIEYGDLEFAFTGRVERLRRDVESMDGAADPDTRLAANFDLLRFERRFDDLRALVEDRTTATTVRQRGFREQQAAGISDKPVAELRGWAALLVGDQVAAEANGKALLDYAQRGAASPRDAVYLKVLRAEGHLFAGDRAKAIEEARATLAETNAEFATNTTRFVGTIAARVLAWAGAEDEATAVLERLATEFTALGPAEIVRDPLFAIPLAGNDAYQRLALDLEAAIARNQQIFP